MRKPCAKRAAKFAAGTSDSALRSKTGPTKAMSNFHRKKKNVVQRSKFGRQRLRTRPSNKSCAPLAARLSISRCSELINFECGDLSPLLVDAPSKCPRIYIKPRESGD